MEGGIVKQLDIYTTITNAGNYNELVKCIGGIWVSVHFAYFCETSTANNPFQTQLAYKKSY